MAQPLFESYLKALNERIKYEPRERADKILLNERNRFEQAERALAEYAASDDEDAPEPSCPYSAGEIAIILNEISARMSPYAEPH
jgi:hypothetical protein